MPAPAAQFLVMSCNVSSIAAGTPSAAPEEEPKLDRMSLRTTPDSMRTFGPFDPSPGYGPAVSAGAAAAPAAASTAPAVVVTVDAEPVACLDVPPAHAATSAEAPAAPASWNIRRRESTFRSWARPRSCSWGWSVIGPREPVAAVTALSARYENLGAMSVRARATPCRRSARFLRATTTVSTGARLGTLLLTK